MHYIINGKFLARPVNGQGRVAIEIIKELDYLVPPEYIEIVAPESEFSIDGLKNIKIRRFGKTKGNGHIWEQTFFYSYIRKSKCLCINFLNSHPLFRPDIAYIHDVLQFAYPTLYSSLYGKLQNKYNALMEKITSSRAIKIITVSEFSKKEIIKYLNTSQEKIHVIYNGWQHMQDVVSDYSVFDKFPHAKKGKYFLAASGVTPQKNFKWILENAKHNPDSMYVIIGGKVESTQDEIINSQNVIFTGRLEDSEMKALMAECRAFIHPALYEGFGLTPLEAAASGCAKIIVSNASCLPEIYGDSVIYIDPFNPSVDIDEVCNSKNCNVKQLLTKYSWKRAAKELYEVINRGGDSV